MTKRPRPKTATQVADERRAEKAEKARLAAQNAGMSYRNEVATRVYTRLVPLMVAGGDKSQVEALCAGAAQVSIIAGNALMAAIVQDQKGAPDA